MRSPAQGPQHWRERASNARTVADWMKNPKAKRLLLEIAERYECIAVLAQSGDAQFTMPNESKK